MSWNVYLVYIDWIVVIINCQWYNFVICLITIGDLLRIDQINCYV